MPGYPVGVLVIFALACSGLAIWYLGPSDLDVGRRRVWRLVSTALFLVAMVLLICLRLTVLPTSLMLIALCAAYHHAVTERSVHESLYMGSVLFLCYDLAVLMGPTVLGGALEIAGFSQDGLGFQAITAFFGVLVLALSVFLVRRMDQSQEYRLSAAQCLLILAPMVSYLYVRSGIYVMAFNGWVEERMRGEMVLILLSLLPTFVVVLGLRNVLSAQVMRNEILRMQELMTKQHQQYLIKRETIDLMNKKYHDMKHFASLMSRGAATGERERDEFERGLVPYSVFVDTGCPIVDVILADKIQYCNDHEIRLVPFVDASKLGFLGSLELCTIFGNALDNAIEATVGLEDVDLREIKVKVAPRNDMIAMNFTNNYAGEVHVADGMPVSTKRDANHGFGIANIRHVAEEHGGQVTFSASNGRFTLNVLVPLPYPEATAADCRSKAGA